MKKLAFTFILFIVFAFLSFERNPGRIDKIRITGFFYKYIPYHVKYDSENIGFKILRGNIKVTPSRDETFALNLLDDGRAEFLLFDSITGESLKLEADVKTPEITPIVAGDGMNFISGDVISKNDMLSCEGLLCQLWNYNIDLNFSINSFALLLQRKGSDIDTIYSDGPLFNEAQRNAIRGIQNSQVIVIDQIRVYEPLKNSTELIKVPPVSLFLQF